MDDGRPARKSASGTVMAYLALLTIAAVGLSVVQPVRVTGGSMRPALVSGDVVFVRHPAVAHPGDIVLVHAPGREPVLHRAVEAGPGGALVTKGDANRVADRDLAVPEHVRGRVVAVLPVGKLIERWRSP